MEQATNNSGKTVSTKSAIISILVAILLFVAVGVGIGKTFFWSNYNKMSKVDYALAQNQERVKADPMNPNKLVQLGYTYFQKKDYQQAITYYKQALKYDDKLFSGHLNLGMAYANIGQMTKAEESIKNALEIIPKSEVAHLNLGMVYIKEKKYNDAQKELEIAQRSNPGSVEILYYLGLAYEKLGNKENAISVYQEAVSYEPNFKLAKEGLKRVQAAK